MINLLHAWISFKANNPIAPGDDYIDRLNEFLLLTVTQLSTSKQ